MLRTLLIKRGGLNISGQRILKILATKHQPVTMAHIRESNGENVGNVLSEDKRRDRKSKQIIS